MPTRPYRPPLSSAHSERHDLAQGLLRLSASDDLSAIAEQNAQHMAIPAASHCSAGDELRRLIRTTATANAVWSQNRLEERSYRLRAAHTWEHGLQDEDAYFFADRRVMNVVSHAIEERVIANRIPTEVYAGFQRLALLGPQLLRYRALLNAAAQVYVYGLDDRKPDDRVLTLRHPHLLSFVIDPARGTEMEHFWFVVVNHPRLCTALLAEHTGGDLWGTRQALRTYTGIWTFNPERVQHIVEILRRAGHVLYAGQQQQLQELSERSISL